jgi:hypothetical protein
MAIGVFGLQVAYKLKRLEVMSTDDTHGYFGGGRAAPFFSTVDRIDFSNDTGTANIRGPLVQARSGLAAAGNSNYGWFGGGYFFPAATWYKAVDRIDFANDSTTASFRGSLLSQFKSSLAATGNSNYGWFGGGYTNFPAVSSAVDRLDFSNDVALASPRGTLSLARYGLAATGNSNYGWFGGGTIPGPTLLPTVERIDYTNDYAAVSPRSSLSLARGFMGVTGNSNYGWFGGGGIPAYVATVDRIDFSNDAVAASVRGSLSSARYALAATGNSNYGWFCGGGIPAYVATVDRIDFSNDSVSASPRGPLSAVKGYGAATSGQAKGPAIKLQKAGNYGWFGGGVVPATTVVATVDRIDFSNDTVTGPSLARGSLFVARCQLAATGNSNYGWFGGGTLTSSSAQTGQQTVERIDFSNDSTTLSPRGPLISTTQGSGATGNSNYGWFAGSYPARLTVNRINFSNDSSTESVRGPLSSGRYQLAATGNSNYGWFGGGWIFPGATATVDRIDFSNDLAAISIRGTLRTARYGLAATGNSNYGWFGGGQSAIVDRIDFSNDSIQASPRGTLSLARLGLTATGNSNYGWFGGGSNTPVTLIYSRVDRIDFSNDSATVSIRGTLNAPAGRYKLSATSNSTR